VSAEPLLRVEGLRIDFPIGGGLFGRAAGVVRAVDGVSFSLAGGEVLGVVGESGSGKTTLGRGILRLIEPTAGSVRFQGRELIGLPDAEMRLLRSRMQIVFQDPYASLNPRLTIGDAISEAMLLNNVGTRADRPRRVADLLHKVGLPPGAAARFPKEFSGGQRQRAVIARALSVNPIFILADEPVSALDVSIQAQILNLLRDLQDDLGLSVLFIGHDLSVVEYLCDRVMILYLGRVMEIASTADIYLRPRHPYTRALIDAAPRAGEPRRRDRTVLGGEPPSPVNVPSGCVFRTRCRYAKAACAQEVPPLRTVGEAHAVACIRDDLAL
jgi:oligopeptide/dipeptide ABC transporter ATP-binding protein